MVARPLAARLVLTAALIALSVVPLFRFRAAFGRGNWGTLQAIRYVKGVDIVSGPLDPDAVPVLASGKPDAWFVREAFDTPAKAAACEAAGGGTIVPRTVIPEVVTFGMMSDPAGNILGIVERDVQPAQ